MIETVLDTALPILLAAIGGTIAERTGLLNIGLEGLITLGAFFGFLVVSLGTVVGYLVAATVSGAAALIPAILSTRFRANVFIAALALNLTIAGFVPVVSQLAFQTRGVVQAAAPLDELLVGRLPVPTIVGLVATVVIALAFRYTRTGILLDAAGQAPDILRRRGKNPHSLQIVGMVLSGVFCGLAGMYLVVRLDGFVPNIAAGRGWLALVAVFVGLRTIVGAGIAAVGFALVDVLTNEAQGLLQVPGTLLLAVPYLVTLIAYVVSVVVAESRKRARLVPKRRTTAASRTRRADSNPSS